MRRLAAVLLALALAPAARADTVNVFAAASLKEVLDAAGREFEAATGHRVRLAYAASNALARQIEKGAPADVYIAADGEWIDHLDRGGHVLPGSRRNVAANELVLVAPAASPVSLRLAPGVDLARPLGGRRIALAGPAVPAGKYARAALAHLGAWDALESRTASADNVRAALALVARGECPLGVVYRTDAEAEKNVRIVASFPAGSHPPIAYPMVTLRRARGPAPGAFADWLASPGGRALFRRFGFGAP